MEESYDTHDYTPPPTPDWMFNDDEDTIEFTFEEFKKDRLREKILSLNFRRKILIKTRKILFKKLKINKKSTINIELDKLIIEENPFQWTYFIWTTEYM